MGATSNEPDNNQECEITLFQVGWLKAKDQTILALHHRVITHNERFGVDHDDNRYELKRIRIQNVFSISSYYNYRLKKTPKWDI